MSAALIVILMLWNPREHGTAIGSVVITLSVISAGTVWLGAVIGVLTASWRAV